VWALAPATALALPGLLRPVSDEAKRARVPLAAWALLGLVLVMARPVHFSLQFLVGLGTPLLALAALGAAARPPRLTLLLTGLLSTTSVVLLVVVARPAPEWFVPSEDMAIVRALRASCRPGDVVFAPPSIGVFAYGLTPCRAYVSHRIDPRYEEKLAELQGFAALPPEGRAALLDARRITHLVLPGDAGPEPVAWLGPGGRFRRSVVAAGSARAWSLYDRAAP
jgi:hypothetical protein